MYLKIAGRASIQKTSTVFSNLFLQRSRKAWGWGLQFAARLSKPTVAAFGSPQAAVTDRYLTSSCRQSNPGSNNEGGLSNDALGHEPPRHLGERAAVMPPKAAAPSRDKGGRGGPTTDSRSAANKFHHSITSSARTKSVCGIVNPSALAVFRLMTSSNLTVWWTGRSAGLAPLRSFPT